MKQPAFDITEIWEDLVWQKDTKIIYLVLDGLGGLPDPKQGGTELQAANTPHLDNLTKESSCGLLDIVGTGITPGSGPGHLALFGYNPLKYRVGRGVLSALGIDFDLEPGDVAARLNFATIDQAGKVTDRRAGRIATDLNQRLCQKIRDKVSLDFEGTYFLKSVSEHRAVLVLRGDGLGDELNDTDPQTTGVPPREPEASSDAAAKTAQLVQSFLRQVKEVLADEEPANMVLMRGFERYDPLPSLRDRFGLTGLCIADYPMYRGVSRLIGMDVAPRPGGLEKRFESLTEHYSDDHNFYFLHVKKSDSEGEDADFPGKVKILEEVDRLLPQILSLAPDVIVVAADHSTPATLGGHSWHPVPFIVHAKSVRVDAVAQFDEYACSKGILGRRPGIDLIGLALANAGRLRKFGA
jgi:2,3-bisphosphoglycerate-independent phosphoglycerate mutase